MVVATGVLMSSIDTEYRHPAVEAVAAIAAGLDALAEASLWSMSTADVGRLVVAIERIDRRVTCSGGCGSRQLATPRFAHHDIHRADGGPTSRCNLVLLCVHHHDRVHSDGWTIKMVDRGPWFIPPAWLDPQQRPRQNSRYRVRGLDHRPNPGLATRTGIRRDVGQLPVCRPSHDQCGIGSPLGTSAPCGE